MNNENPNEDRPEEIQQGGISQWGYAGLSLAALVIGIGAVAFLLVWDLGSERFQAAYYLTLLIFGCSVAAFLFGAMRSYASFVGRRIDARLELGGPVVVAVLVVLGAYFLPQPQGDNHLVVRLVGPAKFRTEPATRVFVSFPGFRDDGTINALGEVRFERAPETREKLQVALDSDFYKIASGEPHEYEANKYNRIDIHIDEIDVGPNAKPYRVAIVDTSFSEEAYDQQSPASARLTNAQTIEQKIRNELGDRNIVAQAFHVAGVDFLGQAHVESFKPDLIIIHRSAFNFENGSDHDERRLKAFIRNVQDTSADFLIFSRQDNTDESYESGIAAATSISASRINAFQFERGNPWADPAQSSRFISRIAALVDASQNKD